MGSAADLVLLTRPRAASEEFAAALKVRSDAAVMIAPVIEILPVGDKVETSGYAGVIFTSANAVPRAVPSPGLPAYCVGKATAAAAKASGFDALSAEGDANDLIALIRRLEPPTPLLHLRGEHASGDIAKRLTAAGLPTKARVVYRQKDVGLTKEELDRIACAARVIAPVFSPRSAARLASELGQLPRMTVVAISPAAAAAYAAGAGRIVNALAPTQDAMLDAVADALDSDSQSPV